MYVGQFEIIESWHLTQRLESNEDLIITRTVNKKLPGKWIMKIKCMSFYEEITGIEKYLTGCENAVSIPRNCKWNGIDKEREFRWYIMQEYNGDISKRCLFTKVYIHTLLKDVVSFLKHIHLQGAVHGDLKLKNILYSTGPVKFYVCDYEFLKSIEDHKKVTGHFESYVDYYYSYLGIPSGKPKFGYRSDLTAFGYILWSILICEKETDAQFKWQNRAIHLYNIRESEDFLFEIDVERDCESKRMPAAIIKYFTFLQKLSWIDETPPAAAFYDELAEMRLE